MSSSNEIRPLTVGEIFNFAMLKTDELDVRIATDKVLGKDTNPVPLVEESTFLGIEVEVEGMQPQRPGVTEIAPFWNCKEDGSLRNTGLEFVSIPLRGRAVPAALTILNRILAEVYTKHDFSDRTSVHVHVNVRNISVESLINFLLTYSVFESALYKSAFDFTQKKRDENIFCVSLFDAGRNLQLAKAVQCLESGELKQCLGYLSSGWKKYSGVNCIPVQSFGTVEFRQLGGTENIRKIIAWINLILAMKMFAENSVFSMLKGRILELNTNSMYEMFTQEVFRNQADQILRYNVKNELEKGVNYVKYLFSSNALGVLPVKTTVEAFMTSSLKKFYDNNHMTIVPPVNYEEKYKKKPFPDLSVDELIAYRADISLARKMVSVSQRLAIDESRLSEASGLEGEAIWLSNHMKSIDSELQLRGLRQP